MPAYNPGERLFLQKPALEQAALDKLPGCPLTWRKSRLEAASQVDLVPQEILSPAVAWI